MRARLHIPVIYHYTCILPRDVVSRHRPRASTLEVEERQCLPGVQPLPLAAMHDELETSPTFPSALSPRIPPEIVGHILSYFTSTRDLRNTSLVSTLWIDPSRRRLFDTITIPNESTTLHTYLMCLPRIAFLALRPHISRYVVQLHIRTTENPWTTVEDAASASLGDFIALRPWEWLHLFFPNISHINILDEHSTYPPYLFFLAPSLPRLRTLDVRLNMDTPPSTLALGDTRCDSARGYLPLHELVIGSFESNHMAVVLKDYTQRRLADTLRVLTIELARDITPRALETCLHLISSFTNLSELDLGIYLVHNTDMLDYHATDQMSSVMSGIASGAIEQDVNTYSLNLPASLSHLRIDVIANSTTVSLLRGLLYQSDLPGLHTLEVTIGMLYDPETSRADWSPFGKDTSTLMRRAILAPNLAHHLKGLKITFEAECTDIYVHKAQDFLDLFEGTSANRMAVIGVVWPMAALHLQ
jgi:hypothetical protein